MTTVSDGTRVSRPAADDAITPCVKLCCLDPATGLCQGCGRTLDEIARWASLDATARRAIMNQLPRRLALAAAPGHEDGVGR